MALTDVLTTQDVAARSNGTVSVDDPRLEIYVADALNDGALVAPCLQSDALSDVKLGVAKRVLADVVLRRISRDNQPEESNLTSESWQSGPFSRTVNFDTSQATGFSPLTNADEAKLRALCANKTPKNIRMAIPTMGNPYATWPPSVPS